jgi:FSR family fosmidomycin resistance protein-like MFS transporter
MLPFRAPLARNRGFGDDGGMAAMPETAAGAAGGGLSAAERRAAGVACGAHALHDGYTDLIYVMLPVWQGEFGLGYAELGLLRAVMVGATAGLQIPATFVAERIGVPILLAGGTALAGLGFGLAGAGSTFAILTAALVIAGIGSSTQHPLASGLMARAFAGARSRAALGSYNFAGDVGKMALPLMAAVMFTVMPWRPALALLGGLGFMAAIAILLLTPRFGHDAAPAADDAAAAPSRSGAGRRHGFALLLSIGVIDSATRMGFLTFLPFVLTQKGAGLPAIGLALTLVFAGGAAGKLVCAFIGARIGMFATVCLTESLTAVTIAALLWLPLTAGLVLLPLLGIALNGTSSVLYGSVPDLVAPARRIRAFGVFYTGTIGSGALAPALYGVIGDLVGITSAVLTLAAIVLLTIPLAALLRPSLPAPGKDA